jgi:hypothetical protein
MSLRSDHSRLGYIPIFFHSYLKNSLSFPPSLTFLSNSQSSYSHIIYSHSLILISSILLLRAAMASLASIANHLVLPPKLPDGQDQDVELIEMSMVTALIESCKTLRDKTNQNLGVAWDSLSRSLEICLELNRGRLEKSSLLNAFRNLKPGIILILFVVEQNAAVLIRHNSL